MPTNFIGVLLTTTPNYTVNTGFVSQLYDARGAQTITVQSGASLDLVGALGANIFNLQGNASTWQVWRDGSTVILSNASGDRVNLPAQLDAQKIVFADLQTNIRIDTSTGSAQVKMGGMVLDSTPTTITATALSTGNPNSAQKAPWSLVMNASVGTKSGGYSQALLVSDGSADGTANQAINQAATNIFVSPDATKASFTVDQGDGTAKLEVISEGVVTEEGLIDSTARAISMGDKVFYVSQSQDTSAKSSAVTDWNTNQTKFSNVMGVADQTFKTDTLNQAIWVPKYFGPYGTELVKIGLDSDGKLSAVMAKDIASGANSGVTSSKYGSGQIDAAVLPDGRFVFIANNGSTGIEPWISDGTSSGTLQLRDLYSSSSSKNGSSNASSNPANFVTLGDKVVFTADVNKMVDGTISEKGRELVISDGTEAGTVVYDLALGTSGSYPQMIGQLNGYLYFATQTAMYRTNGGEPEKLTDWTYSGVQILGYTDQKAYLTKIDETRGTELWVANLTTRTVSLVKDILTGTGSAMARHSFQIKLLMDDKFVFTAYKSANEVALFVTDGTEAKTFEIVTANIYQIQAMTNDLVVYRTSTGLYSFQIGTSAPSVVTLSDVALSQSFQKDKDQVYYQTSTGSLYSSGGTVASTVKLADKVLQFKVIADDAIYFTQTNTNTTNVALWYSDGTAAGTRFIEDLPTGNYDISTAYGLRTAGTPLPNDTVAPTLSSVVVNGTTLTLKFREDNTLDAAQIPASNPFTISGTDATVTAFSVDAIAKTVTFTLSKSVNSSDVVKVSYTDPSTANDTLALQDASGNDLASFTNRVAINQTPDNVPPLFSNAVVNGSTLTLTYTDASLLDAINIPLASRFAVGGTTATVSNVAVSASNKTVTLSLSAAVKSTDIITVSYTDPTAGNDTPAIQDAIGLDAVSLVNAAVSNQSPVEEIKAPWTLLANYYSELYASDGTKPGSGSLTVPNSNGYGSSSDVFTVVGDKNAAVLVKYTGYDNVLQQSIFQAYGIVSSTASPVFLATGINGYEQVLNVGGKVVVTDSNTTRYKGLITDGTVSGTTVVADLPNGIVDSATQTIWARINSAPYGAELFRIVLTDTSPAFTMVKDISSGTSSGFNNLNGAILPNGKFIFTGYNGTYGYEPWVSDGTDAGTFPIDLYPGGTQGGKFGGSSVNSSSPYSYVSFQGEVVFTANVNGWVKAGETITAGQELVFTDGTVAGTHVLDVYLGASSSNPSIIGEANGLLYFAATNADGRGLYSTIGISFNRVASFNDSANLLAWSANKAFFSLSDTTNGAELWVADFSANTFTLVKDILSGSGSGLSGDVGAFMVGDKLIFKAYTSATQQNLFVSNGTSAGTVQIGSSLGAYASLGDILVFADGNSISAANVSGSTPVKVELVNASSAVVKMQSDSDQAFFSLANGDLYATKGATATTVKLASSVKNFKMVAENALYFVVANTQSTTGYDLWYSDGTTDGTRYVEEVQSYIYSSLDTAVAIRTPGTDAPNDIAAPVVSSAVVSGTSLTITFKDDNSLDATNKPAATAFTVSGTDATVSSVAMDATNKTVTLTLSKSVLSSDNIKVSYTDPTTGNDTAAVQDAAGNDAASFTNRYVINQTADNVPPVFSKAEVNGNTLTMTYSDASLLDATNKPTANKFTVSGTTATVSSVVVSAANKTVTLTLSAAVKSTDTVTVSYTDPTTGNDDNAIQDANGYDAVSLTNAVVTNLTPVEEVKAPWTLYVANTWNLYVSDGTKTGTGPLTAFMPNASLNGSSFVVNSNNTFALLLSWVYQYDTNKGANKAFGLLGADTSPIELAKDIEFGYTPIKINNKIILPDNSQSLNGLITDGTVAGTILIPDLPSGIVDSTSQTVWSSINSAPYGRELFKIVLTDSSPSPVIVKDIYPGAESGLGGIQGALLSSGKLVFEGNNSTVGNEVWISDGTSSGTSSLDLYVGTNGSYPLSFTKFGTKVAFSADVNGWVKGNDTLSVGRELVITDGTAAGTNVIDVFTGSSYSSPEIIGEANSLLYFTATSATGRGIYSTNGTGFTRLADVNSSATRLGWDTSKAFFSFSDSTNGGELWVADFTTNSFSLVKDILPGSGSALSGDIGAFMVNGKLVFKAYTSATQQNLFVSNGTSNGTVKIGNTLGAYAALGDTLVFADGNSISASNLSASAPSTVELVNAGSAVVKMQSDTDQAFFSLANGDLYATNGTLNTTVKLASSVKNFKMVADNAIYLVTADPQSSTGYDLWYSDGTLAGTRFVEDAPAEIFAKLDNAVAILTVGVNV
jgi:uncharacterized repeat protein (TIGR02059 family)